MSRESSTWLDPTLLIPIAFGRTTGSPWEEPGTHDALPPLAFPIIRQAGVPADASPGPGGDLSPRETGVPAGPHWGHQTHRDGPRSRRQRQARNGFGRRIVSVCLGRSEFGPELRICVRRFDSSRGHCLERLQIRDSHLGAGSRSQSGATRGATGGCRFGRSRRRTRALETPLLPQWVGGVLIAASPPAIRGMSARFPRALTALKPRAAKRVREQSNEGWCSRRPNE